MIHEDWLHTIAEVSIALAGFSGLAAGLRDRSTHHAIINRTRLLSIVETALSSLLFSIVPVLLHGLGLSETSAFRVAAVFFVLGCVPLCYRGFRRFFEASDGLSSAASRGFGNFTIAGTFIGITAGLLCALGVPRDAVPTLYIISLVGILTIGAANFTGFAATLVDVPEKGSDEPE